MGDSAGCVRDFFVFIYSFLTVLFLQSDVRRGKCTNDWILPHNDYRFVFATALYRTDSCENKHHGVWFQMTDDLSWFVSEIVIVRHPVSVCVPVNHKVTLRVRAEGKGVLSYQWFSEDEKEVIFLKHETLVNFSVSVCPETGDLELVICPKIVEMDVLVKWSRLSLFDS